MKIGHVYFVVKDVPASVKFYTELLGMPPINIEGERWADWGNKGCLALLSAKAIAPQKVVYGNNAVLNLETENLKAAFERAKTLGAKVIEKPYVLHKEPYLYECCLVQDLDGNLIEIAHWR